MQRENAFISDIFAIRCRNSSYEFKLWIQAMNLSYEFKLWIQAMNLSYEFKLWIQAMNLSYEFKLWIQAMNSSYEFKLWILFWLHNLSLKYQRLTSLDYKDIGIGKYLANT